MSSSGTTSADPYGLQAEPVSSDLQTNRTFLEHTLRDCADVTIRPLRLGDGTRALLCYASGQTNIGQLERQLLEPLVRLVPAPPAGDLIAQLRESLPAAGGQVSDRLDELVSSAMTGDPALLVDGCARGLTFEMADWDKRAVEEPIAESVVRGPREGFVESFDDNLSMIRRRLRTPAFKIKIQTIGSLTQTWVAVCYIESIAEESLVREVTERLSRIRIDGILDSGNLEEMIQDSTWSPFPQMLSTERPDVAASALMEGRVVLVTEGTPITFIAPASLFSMLQSAEDYYQRFGLGTAIRWLRYIFFLIALLAPSIYVAILTYHQEMVPTALLLSIAKSREDIPFPALVEAILMEVTFEALREAGVRLPKQVGSAVSIVGALVIGQAATSAGLVSPPMVMVVALTGIATFMMPHYSIGIAVRLLRFPIMLLAGFLGLLGVMTGVILVVIHLCHLRSFGQPYLIFFSPLRRHSWKDTFVRVPIWAMNQRPDTAAAGNVIRQGRGNSPAPPKRGGRSR